MQWLNKLELVGGACIEYLWMDLFWGCGIYIFDITIQLQLQKAGEEGSRMCD
jgi:hypothetical protein